MTEALKVIKIMPWRGPNEDVIKGTKTKILLYDNRLEYKIDYTQSVQISLTKNGEETGEEKQGLHYTNEEGVLSKEGISGIIKYAETNYDPKGEPYLVHYLDLTYSGGAITLSCEVEKEKDKAYEDLLKWKYNTEIEEIKKENKDEKN